MKKTKTLALGLVTLLSAQAALANPPAGSLVCVVEDCQDVSAPENRESLKGCQQAVENLHYYFSYIPEEQTTTVSEELHNERTYKNKAALISETPSGKLDLKILSTEGDVTTRLVLDAKYNETFKGRGVIAAGALVPAALQIKVRCEYMVLQPHPGFSGRN